MKEYNKNREVLKLLGELLKRYPCLKEIETPILKAFDSLKKCFKNGGMLYLGGNGGSAADCEHIVGELMKSFKKPRPIAEQLKKEWDEYPQEGKTLGLELEGGLPALSLCGQSSFFTAYLNDKNPYLTFAQQVNVLGKTEDAFMAISTSGNSKNCVYAAIVAKAKGMSVIFLGGKDGGRLKELADVSMIVPEKETYRIQELHLPIYHCLCAMLECEFFG